MKNLITILSLFVFFQCTNLSSTPKVILLIGHELDHPEGTHLYMLTLQLFADCLKQTSDIEAHVINGWPEESLLDKANAIVLYGSPGAEICLKKGRQAAFDRAMKRGAGLMAIHWSTGIDEKNLKDLGMNWSNALGGYWVHFSGVEVDTARLEQVVPSHPICRGWSPYDLKDEFYLQPALSSTGQSLLKVKVNEEDLMVAWVAERPNSNGGRSFATTLGHFAENFQIEAFRQMIINGIFWVAKKEIPRGGALCEY